MNIHPLDDSLELHPLAQPPQLGLYRPEIRVVCHLDDTAFPFGRGGRDDRLDEVLRRLSAEKRV
jgi:hypothetical protein